MSPHPPSPFKFKGCPDTPTPTPQPPWPGANRVRMGGCYPEKCILSWPGGPGRCRLPSKIHPPAPATHEKDPVVQAAAVSRGAALGERGRGPPPPPCCSSSAPLKGKKTGHVCVGRGEGKLHRLHVCAIKTWLHPRGLPGKLKGTGLCPESKQGQLGFFCFVLFLFQQPRDFAELAGTEPAGGPRSFHECQRRPPALPRNHSVRLSHGFLALPCALC